MKEKMFKWFDRAKWWHFWNPGSGIIGGGIGFIIIMSIIHSLS